MTSVAVVGGGFGGVGAAAMLRRAGYEDVVVFERGERVGGVWQHNTYPGAACDIPSHLYEFSFAPNHRWSRRYAPQAEIQAYVEGVAREHGVLDRIRTGTEVTARALGRGARQVDARDDRGPPRGRRPPDRLRPAVGPQRPSDPRARRLRGPGLPHGAVAPRRRPRRPARRGDRHRVQRHPGRARHPADRRARRRLPALPGLDVPEDGRPLQRAGPAPVRALPGRPAPRPRRHPGVPGVRRARDDQAPLAAAGVPRAGPASDHQGDRGPGAAAQGHADRRDGLQADHAHRRLVPDAHEARASTSSSTAIAEVEPGGIRTADGTERPADVLVLATGFRTHGFVAPMEVVGDGGRQLAEEWGRCRAPTSG